MVYRVKIASLSLLIIKCNYDKNISNRNSSALMFFFFFKFLMFACCKLYGACISFSSYGCSLVFSPKFFFGSKNIQWQEFGPTEHESHHMTVHRVTITKSTKC